MQADPAPRAERVDGDVAALGDHRHGARLELARPSRPRSPPGSRPRRSRCRSARRPGRSARRAPAARSSASSSRPDSTSPKPAENTIAPPQPRSAPRADGTRRPPPPGSRPRPRRRAREARRGSATHGAAVNLASALRVHAPDGAREPGALEVSQHVAAVGAGAVVGADDRDRARSSSGPAVDGRAVSEGCARRHGARAPGRRSAAGSRSCPPRSGRRAARAAAARRRWSAV